MKSLVGFKVPLQCSHTSSPPFFLATGTNTSDFGLKTQVVTVPDKLEHSPAFLITKPMSCNGILQWSNAIRTHTPHTQTSSLGAHQEWPPFFLGLCGVWRHIWRICMCQYAQHYTGQSVWATLCSFSQPIGGNDSLLGLHMAGAWLCTQAPVRTGTCQGKT